MKEIKLKDSDYLQISGQAHTYWKDWAARGEYFLIKCILNSFLGFLKSHNYTVKDGKIYKDDQNK